MVSALDFRSGGRWFKPGHCRRVVSLDKKLYFTLSLFTQVYQWILAIIMLGVTLQWTSIPSRGGRNIPSCFMLQKPELSDRLAHMQTLPNLYFTFTSERYFTVGTTYARHKNLVVLTGHKQLCLRRIQTSTNCTPQGGVHLEESSITVE